MIRKAFKYRLYPNKEQTEKLQWTLDHCRELYNAALQERRDSYTMKVKHSPNYYDLEWRKQATKEFAIGYYDQNVQLPDIRQAREEYQKVYAQVQQDVLKRVDKAFKAFFARIKNGKNPGYPRFQGKNRYDSFTYPQYGFSLTHDNHIYLSKIGSIKVMLHRPLEGKIKTCTIKREGTEWYVIFSCEVEVREAHDVTSLPDIGIDLGITHFAALSDGTFIDNPRYFRKAQKKLEKLQQGLSRKKKGSHRREKARRLVAKAHRKIRNQRRDFLHKHSRQLVEANKLIIFEELQTTNLVKRPKPKQDENGKYLPNGASAKAGLNKSINDAGWAEFVTYCTYKAEEAGHTVLLVNPRYTSQVCSGCGQVIKKELSERWHSCECGCSLDRDHNAAINILRLGRSLRR